MGPVRLISLNTHGSGCGVFILNLIKVLTGNLLLSRVPYTRNRLVSYSAGVILLLLLLFLLLGEYGLLTLTAHNSIMVPAGPKVTVEH